MRGVLVGCMLVIGACTAPDTGLRPLISVEPIPASLAGAEQAAGPAWVGLSVSDAAICARAESGATWCWGQTGRAHARRPNPPERPELLDLPPLHTLELEGSVGVAITREGQLLRGSLGESPTPLARAPDSTGQLVEVSGYGAGVCARSSGGQLECWSHLDDEPEQRFGRGVHAFDGSGSFVCFADTNSVACVEGERDARVAATGELRLEQGGAAVPELGEVVQLRVAASSIEAGAASLVCGRNGAGVVRCVGPLERIMSRADANDPKTRRAPLDVEVPALPEPARDFDQAIDHGCAVGESGRVHCWGDGRVGQLGDGALHQLDTGEVVTVLGLDDAVEVEVGPRVSCARRASGGVVCWGDGSSIPFGGSWQPRRLATQIDGLRTLATLTCMLHQGRWHCAGSSFSTAVDPLTPFELEGMGSGRLFGSPTLACTEPDRGRMICGGVELEGDEPRWRRTFTMRGVVASGAADGAIAAIVDDRLLYIDSTRTEGQVVLEHPGLRRGAISDSQACALLDDGSAWCRQKDSKTFELFGGAGPATRVAGVADAVELALSNRAACVLHTNQRVSCWGVWPGIDDPAAPQPPRDMGLSGVVELAAERFHVCARTEAGALYCWGSNEYGALGVEALDASAEPVRVAGIEDAVEFGLHVTGGCARTRAAELWCWGTELEFEQWGRGRARPTPMSMPRPPAPRLSSPPACTSTPRPDSRHSVGMRSERSRARACRSAVRDTGDSASAAAPAGLELAKLEAHRAAPARE